MATIADTLVPPARMTLGYADALLADISPAQFARQPEGVNTNHPAWVYGHLGLYPDSMLTLIGRDDIAHTDDAGKEVFGGNSVCRDDPRGDIYPPMNDIVERFRSRHEVLLGALAETDESVFTSPMPGDHPLASRLPTVGATAGFILLSHTMMHLGQVSAWRRAMGLGPCM